MSGMLSSWKFGSGKLVANVFGPSSSSSAGGVPPLPPSSSSSGGSNPTPLSGPTSAMSGISSSNSFSSPSRKKGILSSMLAALAGDDDNEAADAKGADAEYFKAVEAFEGYSAKVARLHATVLEAQATFAACGRAMGNVTAALQALQDPSSTLPEDQRANEYIQQHAAATTQLLDSVVTTMNQLTNVTLGGPLEKILKSHAELRSRMHDRKQLRKEYHKAAKAFASMQKKAAKRSRQQRHGQKGNGAASTPTTWSFAAKGLSAVTKFGLGPTADAGGASAGMPSSPTSPTTQSSDREGISRAMSHDAMSAEGDNDDDDASIGSSEAADTSISMSTNAGQDVSMPAILLPANDDATARAASKLSSLSVSLSGLTDLLRDELAQSVQRRSIVLENCASGAWQLHKCAALGIASCFHHACNSTDGNNSSAASQLDFNSLAASLLPTSQVQPWYDEGAAARAASKANKSVQREQKRQLLVQSALQRAVLHVDGARNFQASTSLPEAMISSAPWLAQLSKFLTVVDLCRVQQCSKSLAVSAGLPSVWLGCVRSGGVDVAARGADSAISSLDPRIAYSTHVENEHARFSQTAPLRLRFWVRALGIDGKPLPSWSAAGGRSGEAKWAPQIPAADYEYQAMLRLALAESAKGAKQDDGASEDADMVYTDERGGVSARWPSLIHQDVLRSYTRGMDFGCSAAGVRAIRLAIEPYEVEEHGGESVEGIEATSMQEFVGGEKSGSEASPEAFLERRRDMVRNILMATAASEPSLRYTQGMSSVARLLLELSMSANNENASNVELMVFNILGALLRFGCSPPRRVGHVSSLPQLHACLASLYAHDSRTLKLKLYQAERLVARYLPDTSRLLGAESLHPSAYASSWVLTLFSNFGATSLMETVHTWDAFLIGGWPEMFNKFLQVMGDIYSDLEDRSMEDIMRRLQAPVILRFSRMTSSCPCPVYVDSEAELKELEQEYRTLPQLVGQYD